MRPSPEQRRDGEAVEISFAGLRLVLDASGALYLPELGALAVADLHLEKGSAFAAAGRLVPRLDTHDTLMRLERCLARYRPQTVLCLGDSFHDARAEQRLAAADGEALRRISGSAQCWVWISGNHDPAPPLAQLGQACDSLTLGGVEFLHIPRPDGAGPQIAGHCHPKAHVKARRQKIGGRCFLAGERLIVMPAFGAYAGGLDRFDDAFAAIFAEAEPACFILYGGKIWPIRPGR